jgi:hypothetical protein
MNLRELMDRYLSPRGKAPGPVTMNMPHYMFYAPGVKDEDIGGHGFDKQHPFILSMNSGRDDYIILLAGETEKAKILEEFKGRNEEKE